MEYRKLIKFGNSSHVISIPNNWLKKNNLNKGDTVYLDENGGKELVLTPEKKENVIEDKEKLRKGGIEFYKLSPDMEKWFLDTSIEACWEEAETKYPAELVNEYRKYLRR